MTIDQLIERLVELAQRGHGNKDVYIYQYADEKDHIAQDVICTAGSKEVVIE